MKITAAYLWQYSLFNCPNFTSNQSQNIIDNIAHNVLNETIFCSIHDTNEINERVLFETNTTPTIMLLVSKWKYKVDDYIIIKSLVY